MEIEVFSGLQTLGTHSAKPGCLGVPVNWEPAKRLNSSLNLTHFDGWRLFIFLENPAPGRLLPLSRVQTEWPCVNGLPTDLLKIVIFHFANCQITIGHLPNLMINPPLSRVGLFRFYPFQSAYGVMGPPSDCHIFFR